MTGKQGYLDRAAQAGDCLISGATTYEWGLGVRECENYGLMGGMAGIGLACVGEVEDVLKLLCLEV